MDYKYAFTKTAKKDLERLDKADAVRILKKLQIYISEPFSYAKKLKAFKITTYRFIVGEFRVIFRKDQKTKQLVILVILKIQHRKDIYNK